MFMVKTTTSKKTTTKKVKMKKAAAKTYTKELPATSTTSKKQLRLPVLQL